MTIHCDLLGTETTYCEGQKYRTRTIEMASDEVPLILMHGGGGHAEAFSRNIVPLSDVCRPVAMDFIWHGLSSKPSYWDGKGGTGKHWLNQFTDQVLELMDVRGWEKAVFEGESLGGWVAVDLGVHHPDRVEGLILNTAWGITFDPAHVAEQQADLDGLRKSSLAALNNPDEETIRRRMEWLMPLGGVTDEIVEVRQHLWGRADTREALTEYYNRLFDPSTEDALFTENDVAKIDAKTLVLWTDHNPIQGVDAAHRLGELIPDASVVIIEEAGHWPQWEKPREHDEAVRAFIQSL